MNKISRKFRANCTSGGGFTLAELLIVVAVIAVLVAVAVPTFGNQLEKSRQTTDLSNLRGAYAAARLCELNNGIGDTNGIVKPFNEYTSVKLENTGKKANADETQNIQALYFWYDPDTGLLQNATTVGYDDTDSNTKADYPIAMFGSNMRGNAQAATVIAATGGLAGAGQKTVLYTNQELANSDNSGNTDTDYAKLKAGTVDKAIRVAFVQNKAGSFKLHEIAYVGSSGALFHNTYVEKAGILDVVMKTTAETFNLNLTSADIASGSNSIDLADYLNISGNTGTVTYTKNSTASSTDNAFAIASGETVIKIDSTSVNTNTTANLNTFIVNGSANYDGKYTFTVDLADQLADSAQNKAKVVVTVEMNK